MVRLSINDPVGAASRRMAFFRPHSLRHVSATPSAARMRPQSAPAVGRHRSWLRLGKWNA